MALTAIMASKAPTGTQLLVFVIFTLQVLAFVEIPLVSYLVAPHKTEATIRQLNKLNTWIQGHQRQIIQTGLAATAIAFFFKGIGGI